MPKTASSSKARCRICKDYGREKYESDFFGGRKSHYLIAKELAMDADAVLDHMLKHTTEGAIVLRSRERMDEALVQTMEEIKAEYERKGALNLIDVYESLDAEVRAVEDMFWQLYSRYASLERDGVVSKEDLQAVMAALESVRRSKDTLLKYRDMGVTRKDSEEDDLKKWLKQGKDLLDALKTIDE